MLWTFKEFLDKRAEESPDKAALICDDVTYTWKEFDVLVRKASQYFIDRNVTSKCKVGIWAPNSAQWLIAFAGLARFGAVPVLINVHYTANELKRIVDFADIKLMCVGSADEAYDCGVDYIDLKRDFLYEIKSIGDTSKADALADMVKPDDTFAMLFTSGTTSFSKGVCVSHHSMIRVAIDAADIMHWNIEDTNCLTLPLFHCFGLSTGFLASVACGSTLVICNSSRTNEILGKVKKYGCTILNGVPTMFFSIVRNIKENAVKIDTLKSGIIAGAAVEYEDYKMICDELGIDKLQMSYGQTECSPSITFSGYDDELELKAKSVGRVIPDVEIKIVDMQSGQDCEIGQTGEICVKGYNVMKGYYKMPKETAKTIDETGWLHTGDLGALDEDGNLYFKGRLKELIIRGGENISPLEIETYIRHFKEIELVKVIGVPAKIIQERIVACIIPKEGYTVDTAELDKYLRTKLAKYKIPEEYVYLEEFPYNAGGKIDVKALVNIVNDKTK